MHIYLHINSPTNIYIHKLIKIHAFNNKQEQYLHQYSGDVTQQASVDAVFAVDPNITGVIIALGNMIILTCVLSVCLYYVYLYVCMYTYICTYVQYVFMSVYEWE